VWPLSKPLISGIDYPGEGYVQQTVDLIDLLEAINLSTEVIL
jgi:hypothetical protein